MLGLFLCLHLHVNRSQVDLIWLIMWFLNQISQGLKQKGVKIYADHFILTFCFKNYFIQFLFPNFANLEHFYRNTVLLIIKLKIQQKSILYSNKTERMLKRGGNFSNMFFCFFPVDERNKSCVFVPCINAALHTLMKLLKVSNLWNSRIWLW